MIFLLIALLLIASPVLANDYAVQFPGYTNATGLCMGNNNPPQPGVDCEAGTLWAPWVPQNGDQNLSHYVVNSNNTLTYSLPPPPAPPAPQPNPIAAAAAMQADTDNIAIPIQVQLGPFMGVLASYPYNPTGVQTYWANLKSQESWLTAPIATAVENDCLSANIVLNPSNNPNGFSFNAIKKKKK